MRIGVDGDGGDNNGENIVTGALRFARNHPGTEVILYVKSEQMDIIRDRRDFPDNVATVPTRGYVGDGFKGGPKTLQSDDYIDSSMVQMLNHLNEGSSDAGFSAGATGPFVLGVTSIIGKISPKVKLVLASEFPNSRKPVSLGVDMGANPRVTPEHILKYSLLAAEYLRTRYGINVPIGTPNIGTEDGKGELFHIEVNQLLRRVQEYGIIDYMGNVEAGAYFSGERKIIAGKAFDINKDLKMAKEASDYTLREIGIRVLGRKLGPGFAIWLKERINKSGGAIMLGANKPIGKGNGNSTSAMIERGLGELHDFTQSNLEAGLIERMKQGYQERHEAYENIPDLQ